MKRTDQLSHALRDLVGMYLREQVEFPEGVFVTVTRAFVPEGKAATTIFLSVIPRARGPDVLALLTPHLYALQGTVQTALARRLVPRLRFALEEGDRVAEGRP